MPEASPPWAGGSTPRWAKVTSGFASPVPAPTTISPGSRCSHDESASSPVISTRPPAHSAIPMASPPVSGTRALRRPATSETTKATSASGASHSPTSTGVPRRTSSRYSDRYTNDPNEPPASVATITVAPRKVRLRNSRRSSIGAATRSSTAAKAARKTSPSAISPSTVGLVHPSALPRSTA